MSVNITIQETIQEVDIIVNQNIIAVTVTRTSGGGGVQTVTGTTVDNTDPLNPVVGVPNLTQALTQGDVSIFIQQILEDAVVTIPLEWQVSQVYIYGEPTIGTGGIFLDKTVVFSDNATLRFCWGVQYEGGVFTKTPEPYEFTTDAIVYYNGSTITSLTIQPNDLVMLKSGGIVSPGENIWILTVTNKSSGGGGTWGSITGTLSDQTDLQTALDGKVDKVAGSRLITSAESTLLGNTSGTNTGDNATNTTSNAYADAKVADTIADGVTTVAPSQNAVFDALDLKQNTSTLIFDSFQKAIMRDNYFWFVPNGISAGVSGFGFSTSERISGVFVYLNNGAITRGLLAFNTTIVPGILAFSRRNDAMILTGLEVVFTRKIQFNSNVSGQRFFSGISKGNQFVAPTNVEPNTLTDIVGVCQLSSSTNMHVVHNDASGTATTIDLGSSYPCTDSQYNYYITIEQTTTTYIVTVERVTVSTGASISTTNTLSTNIPVYNTGTIQLLTWISNNATAAIASYLDGGAIGNVKNQ